MKVKVEINERRRELDLTRVKSYIDLAAGDRVLLKHPYTGFLTLAEVVGIVDGCVTVEIINKHGDADYKMIESKSLYRSVYKINK